MRKIVSASGLYSHTHTHTQVHTPSHIQVCTYKHVHTFTHIAWNENMLIDTVVMNPNFVQFMSMCTVTFWWFGMYVL